MTTPPLYDHAGRPVRPAVPARAPQTASMGWLRREFGDHPARGLTPARLARIMAEAEEGDLAAQARLAADMEERDAHIFAEAAKRKRAVLSAGWSLDPPADASAAERDAAAETEAALRALDADTLLLNLAEALLPGYSAIELEWTRTGGRWLPGAAHARPADWFMARPEDRDALRLRSRDGRGEPLRPLGWIVHRHRALSGYVGRSGAVRVLALPYLFRHYAARDLAEFLDVYGLPMRLGAYPPDASEDEKSALMRAVVGIGHHAAGIIPDGMRIDFHQAADGAADPFMAMLGWAERAISKALCGATLTSQTDDGSGAYALGKVHETAFDELVRSDLRQYARTLAGQLLAPIFALNWPGLRPPAWTFDYEDPEDIALYAEALPKLLAAGMKIPARWARDALRIPAPEPGEEILAAPATPAPVPASVPVHARSMPVRASVAADPPPDPQDPQDAQTETLAQTADRALAEETLAAIRDLVDSAESLPALRDALAAAWPNLPADRFAETMAQALAAAHLAGRYEILEGL